MSGEPLETSAYLVDRAEMILRLGDKSDGDLEVLADHFARIAPLASVPTNRLASEAAAIACRRLIQRRSALTPGA